MMPQTYPDYVPILFVEPIKLQKLLMFPEYQTRDVEIREPGWEWAWETLEAVEPDPVDSHTEIYAEDQDPDKVI